MKSNNKHCVIVDAYSTGNQLASHFKNYGYSIIHVQSSSRIPSILAPSFRQQDFAENIIHEGDLNETAESVSRFKPEFIMMLCQ